MRQPAFYGKNRGSVDGTLKFFLWEWFQGPVTQHGQFTAIIGFVELFRLLLQITIGNHPVCRFPVCCCNPRIKFWVMSGSNANVPRQFHLLQNPQWYEPDLYSSSPFIRKFRAISLVVKSFVTRDIKSFPPGTNASTVPKYLVSVWFYLVRLSRPPAIFLRQPQHFLLRRD